MSTIDPDFSLDEEIDRRCTPALKVHPMVLGDNSEHLFAAGVADMDFKAPPAVLAALQQRLEHGVFGYETAPEGLLPALTAWLSRRHSWEVDVEHILRSPNILDALAIAASLFTDKGDGVIVQPPVFFDFFDVLKENHRTVIENPLELCNGRYQMNFADLEYKASDPKVKMLYLCNPHNPVARVWTEEELRTLGDICERCGVLVVTDEMHGDLVFPGHHYIPFASLGPRYAANSITCLSPGKTFNIASCCSAFTVIPDPARRKAFQTENSRLSVNKNNAFASVAMQTAYIEGSTWLDAVLEYLSANADCVRQRLQTIPGVELIEPEGSFLLWLDFRQLKLSPDVLTLLLRERAGWAVTRGPAFGSQGEGFARLNIGCTRARLEVALDHLELACKALP